MTIQGLEPYAKRKLTLGIVTLTAAEAEYICEHMAFERQRDADHKHIGNLTDQMEHDEWVGMSMLLFANHRRKLWLIDAQHRLRAQVEHGRRTESPVPRKWVVQVVPGDAAAAYARLDTRQKRRPPHVVAEALGLDVPAPLVRSALGAAANVTRYRTEQNQRVTVGGVKVASDQPYRDSIQYCEERKEAFAAFGTALDNLTHNDRRVRKALLTTKVLPICIETIASCGADAVRFWRSVLSGENAGEAARYVRDKMHEPVRATAKKPGYVRPVAAAQGWNAHVKGVFYRSRSDKQRCASETGTT